MENRYVLGNARRWRLFLTRVRLEDAQTGEWLVLYSAKVAAQLAAELNRLDSSQLSVESGPLPRYLSVQGKDGRFYLWHYKGAIAEESLGHTRSVELAQRAVTALNQLDPRPALRSDGRVRAGWF